MALATPSSVKDTGTRKQIAARLRSFSRMYEPHSGREDPVLFAALHDITSRREYHALGEQVESQEWQIFGFEFAGVATIEKLVGIDDLARFTPSPRGGRGGGETPPLAGGPLRRPPNVRDIRGSHRGTCARRR
jgi:hypothetical protein